MLASLALLTAAVACSDGSTAPAATDAPALATMSFIGIAVTPDTSTLAPGGSITLIRYMRSATGALSALAGQAPAWSTSNASIATVSASGVVTGIAPGVARIVATQWGLFSDTTTISVQAATTVAPQLVVSPATVSVVAGGTQRLTVSGTSATGVAFASAPIVWSSSNPNVATVTTDNVVRAGFEVGSATLTGTVLGATVRVPVTTVARRTLSGLAFKVDTFAQYSTLADLLARTGWTAGGTYDPTKTYSEIPNSDLLSIDHTVRYNGHQTLKYNQPGGTARSARPVVYFPAIKSVWFRAKVKFSRGWTTTGTLTKSDNAFKMILWGWSNRTSGRGGFNIVNTNIYLADWNDPTGGAAFAAQRGGTTSSEATDERWYDYIVHYETLATGARTRVWIAPDGATPVKRIDMVTPFGPSGAPLVNRVHWGDIMNQERGASASQAFWFGQWEIVDASTHANPFGLDLGGTSWPTIR